MKVLLLGAGSVVHTQRWANGLAEAGLAVVCASQHAFLPRGWHAAVEQVRLPWRGPVGYAMNARAVARLFAQRRCTLLNAHYATGYGTTARLSGVRPAMVSVWGSDVFDFPRRSPLHRAWLQGVLRAADAIGSTSEVMADCVRALLAPGPVPPVFVTPFGVETARFVPGPRVPDGSTVIGTVKTLAPKYGIDTLLQAFARLPADPSLTLRIVGDGPQRAALEALAGRLGIAGRTTFVGPVDHAAVPAELGKLDVFVAASRLDSESFGVAVVEASACALPVVVTRVGGLPEVVQPPDSDPGDEATGFVVPKEDPAALAAAIETLRRNVPLRLEMGAAGRRRVQRRYEWRDNVQTMIDAYRALPGPRA